MAHLLCCNIGDAKKSLYRGPKFLWAIIFTFAVLRVSFRDITITSWVKPNQP